MMFLSALRDGLIARADLFPDRDAALAAAAGPSASDERRALACLAATAGYFAS
jgi:hypothetical protein